MRARFRILASPTTDGTAPVVERVVEVTVAEGDGAELRLGRRADVELPLPFPALSAVHARVRRGAGEDAWLVEDAGSTNGTWLAGAPLAPGEPRPLTVGAELRLADVRLRFEGVAPGAAAAAAEGTATIARRLVDDLFAGAGVPVVRVADGAPARRLALAETGRTYIAGREGTCDLPLGVEEVSREHAAFVRDDTGVVVRDLGSKNGVLVGGVRIAGERRLADGDVVAIGPVTLAFEDPADRYLRELRAAPVIATHEAAAVVVSTPPRAAVRRVAASQISVGVAVAVLVAVGIAVATLVFGRG
jgi:pSer/pThr/pTyr-binding forkhead associated (FHA) protein